MVFAFTGEIYQVSHAKFIATTNLKATVINFFVDFIAKI